MMFGSIKRADRTPAREDARPPVRWMDRADLRPPGFVARTNLSIFEMKHA
jgi:hypothetical protein